MCWFGKSCTITLLLIVLTSTAAAQESASKRYFVGGHSAIILGSMKLSDIDASFSDLTTDGIKGPHHSGLFFQYAYRPYLRLGLETLVGNSDENGQTTMNFQAAGPVAEFVTLLPVSLSGGLHMGAMIMNAMNRSGIPSSNKVHTGTYFKTAGVFLAPFAGIGTRIRTMEVRLFAKYILVAGENQVSAFSAFYTGIGFSYGI